MEKNKIIILLILLAALQACVKKPPTEPPMPSDTPSRTFTPTPAAVFTDTPTAAETVTLTYTPENTPSITPAATDTAAYSPTQTMTETRFFTATLAVSFTPTVTTTMLPACSGTAVIGNLVYADTWTPMQDLVMLKVTMPEESSVVRICMNVGGPGFVRAAVYSDNAGAPGTLLTQGAGTTSSGTAYIDIYPVLVPAGDCWIGFQTDSAPGPGFVNVVSPGAAKRFAAPLGQPLPPFAGTATDVDAPLACYMAYCVSSQIFTKTPTPTATPSFTATPI